MFLKLLSLIREHPSDTLAILIGLGILTLAFVDPHWWGDFSLGILFGVGSTALVAYAVLYFIDKVTSWDVGDAVAWVLVSVPVLAALLVRKYWSIRSIPSRPWVVNLPPLPSPQSLLLIIAGLGLFILMAALIASLHRGESVSVDSHWGGLGGGIAGWRLSAPLVYLLGIAFVLAVSSAVAWRVFPAPAVASPPSQQQTSPPVNSSPVSGVQH